MRIIKIAFILTLYILTSCKNSNQHTWIELPQVTNISKLRQTQFVPTLENSISDNKNIIYAPAFLYAWEKVKQKLKAPINLTNNNSNEFKLLNQSTSFKNTLTDDEYSAEAEIVDSIIRAKAFFNKTLPFQSKLQRLDNPILFNKTKVLAFGMQSYDEEAVKFTKILYYKDDDHFIIKLIPKDNADEIQLIKGVTDVVNLSDAIKKTNRLIDLGNKEKSNPKISWKYSLNNIDIFSIPSIKFNIESNYNEIKGQAFTANSKKYHVENAYQRTGFILNENGAVVENEAYTTVTDSSVTEPIKILPKKMVFDKPFFIIIKHTKNVNPYFVMFVKNAELLTRE